MRRCCGDRWSTHLTKDREREKERDWMAQMEDLSRDPRGRFNDASTIWRVPGRAGPQYANYPHQTPLRVCTEYKTSSIPHTPQKPHSRSRTITHGHADRARGMCAI